MKQRPPTEEERKLWRESNRGTRRFRKADIDETVAKTRGASPPAGEATRLSERSELSRSGEGAQGLADNRHAPLPLAALDPLPQGERVASPSRLGPDSAVRPLARLPHLATREAAKRFRNHPIEATLDLHGETKLEAHARVQQFLARQHRAGRRHVVIITGKGKGGVPGVLRTHLPDWLNEAPNRALISAIAYAPPEKGGAGVTHVLLKAR